MDSEWRPENPSSLSSRISFIKFNCMEFDNPQKVIQY